MGYSPWGCKESDTTERLHSLAYHVLAIIKSSAMNTGVQASFQSIVFSKYVPRSEVAGSYGSPVFSFLRNFRSVSAVAVPVHIPSSSAGGSFFSSPLQCLSSVDSLMTVILAGARRNFTVVSVCISLILVVSNVQCLFTFLLATSKSFLEKGLFRSLVRDF